MALEELVIEINSKSTEGTQAIDNFIKSLKRLKSSLNFADKNGGDTSGIDSIVGKIGKIQTAIDGINTKKLNDLASVISGINRTKVDFGDKIKEQTDKAVSSVSDMKNLPGGDAMGSVGVGVGDTRVIQNFGATDANKAKLNDIFTAIRKGSATAWGDFKKSAESAFSSIARIAKYRLIRTALKEISQGFNEGLKNAYEFSKTVNYSLASSLDKLESASLKMKNQLGASFGALIEAVLPLLLKFLSVVTRIADVITQIFAAFGGQVTYLKATDVATSWGDATKAAKAYQRTVLGFDELNMLNGQNSGGGSSTPGASSMFKVADIDPKILKNLDLIKTAAVAIGAALATWKILSFLKDIGVLALSMEQILGLVVSVVGAVFLIKGFISSIKKCLNWGNLLTMLGGATALTIGLAAAFGQLGAAIGILIGGIALVVAGFIDWIKTGELSTATFVAIEAGLLAIGVAISLLTANPIPLLIAAIGMVVVYTIKYWDEIKTSLISAWEWIKEKAAFVRDWIKTKLDNIASWIGNKLKSAYDSIATKINTAIDGIENILGKKDWLESMRLPTSADWARYGAESGRALGDALAKNVNIKMQYTAQHGGVGGRLNATLNAGGGFPAQGSAFIAGEVAGQYEFVGDINGRTGVVSGAEISGIGDAIRDGTAILASLMRQGNEYARETASKDYNPTVSVTDINNAQSRNNRRLGTTVAALAY